MTPVRARSFAAQARPFEDARRRQRLADFGRLLVEVIVLLALLVAIPACLYLLAQP